MDFGDAPDFFEQQQSSTTEFKAKHPKGNMKQEAVALVMDYSFKFELHEPDDLVMYSKDTDDQPLFFWYFLYQQVIFDISLPNIKVQEVSNALILT